MAPAPPQVPGTIGKANNVDSVTSGVSWPLGSIPRRVKKLSWDDDDDNNKVRTRMRSRIGVLL